MTIPGPTRLLLLGLTLGLTALVLVAPNHPERATAALSGPASSPLAAQDDDAAEALLGTRVLEQNCLMCHSLELIQSQRLNRMQWTAEVDKMIGWGAPVPPEERERLIEHLVRSCSPDRPAAAIERLSLNALLSSEPSGPPAPVSGDAKRGATLYAAHCASCHGPLAEGGDLGTCLVGRPVLVSGSTYDMVVRQGLRRMPGFAEALKPQDQADILSWLRQQ